ncbi:MAG: fibronectin type III domain-containing protein, partial [Thermoplasmatota archaeon]
ITALNRMGESAPSEEVAIVPIGVPSRPLGLKAVPGDGEVGLEWSAPSGDGGSPIKFYSVHRSVNGGPFEQVSTVGSDKMAFTDINVENGNGYQYYVRSINAAGTSPPSETVSAFPAGVPGAPPEISAVSGDGMVELEWSAPPSDGGSELTGFIILRGESEGDMEEIASVGAFCLGFIDDTAVNGRIYFYSVAAENLLGRSGPGAIATASPIGYPSEPVGLKAEIVDGAVHLSWEMPKINGGSQELLFNIYRKVDGTQEIMLGTAEVLEFVDEEVSKGSTYSYRVCAVGIPGEGLSTSTVDITLPEDEEEGPGVLMMLFVIGISLLVTVVTLISIVLILNRGRRREVNTAASEQQAPLPYDRSTQVDSGLYPVYDQYHQACYQYPQTITPSVNQYGVSADPGAFEERGD